MKQINQIGFIPLTKNFSHKIKTGEIRLKGQYLSFNKYSFGDSQYLKVYFNSKDFVFKIEPTLKGDPLARKVFLSGGKTARISVGGLAKEMEDGSYYLVEGEVGIYKK